MVKAKKAMPVMSRISLYDTFLKLAIKIFTEEGLYIGLPIW